MKKKICLPNPASAASLYHKEIGFHCPGCGCKHWVPTAGEKKWSFNGDVSRPTISPSIVVWSEEFRDPDDASFVIPATRCHLFVKEGRLEFLHDCTHHLKDQTVDMVEVTDA